MSVFPARTETTLDRIRGWRVKPMTPHRIAILVLVAVTVVAMIALWSSGPLSGTVSSGWTNTDQARVQSIAPARCPAALGTGPGGCRTIRATLTSGETVGSRVTSTGAASIDLAPGDTALVSRDGTPRITVGRDRGSSFSVSLALACVALLVLGGLAGIRTLVALAGVAFTATLFAAPAIALGRPVLPVALVAGSATALLLSWALRARRDATVAATVGSAVVAIFATTVGNAAHLTGSSGELLPATDLRVSGFPLGGMLTVTATIGAAAIVALLAPRLHAVTARLRETGNLGLNLAGLRAVLRANRATNAAAVLTAGLLASVSAGPSYALLTFGGIGGSAMASAPAMTDPVIAGCAVVIAAAIAVLVVAVLALVIPPPEDEPDERPDALAVEVARLGGLAPAPAAASSSSASPAAPRATKRRKSGKRRSGR